MPPVIVCTSQALTLDQKRSLAAAHAIVPKHDVSRDGLTALLRATVTKAGVNTCMSSPKPLILNVDDTEGARYAKDAHAAARRLRRGRSRHAAPRR